MLSGFSSFNNRLVILGSSVTALAVVRDAYRLKMSPLVFDTVSGIASSSRLATSLIVSAPTEVFPLLKKHAEVHKLWLLATSDFWIKFIVDNRGQLDELCEKILHASDEILEICLGKQKFSSFCLQNNIPVPQLYTRLDIENGTPETFSYPLLIRPAETHSSKKLVPKAIEAYDYKQLLNTIAQYDAVGVEPIITQSLLGKNLIQISVGVSRNKRDSNVYAAQKIRPLPEACSVGSFVEVIDDAEALQVATRFFDVIDYYGIGELEILKDLDTNQYYVIEMNARPWVQYSLGPYIGCPLLGLFVNGEKQTTLSSKTAAWIDFLSDAYCCFSRTIGCVRLGKISIFQWAKSLFHVKRCAYLCLLDPYPGILNFLKFFYRK